MNAINVKYLFLVLPIFLLFSSCNGLDSNSLIIGRYYLLPSNSESGKELTYKVDDDDDVVAIVTGNVIAVGHDNNYIIVKQSPQGSPIVAYSNKDTISVKSNPSFKKNGPNHLIQYFIIPIYKDYTYFPEKGILGPLNLDEFNKKKEALKIKVGFTVYAE